MRKCRPLRTWVVLTFVAVVICATSLASDANAVPVRDLTFSIMYYKPLPPNWGGDAISLSLFSSRDNYWPAVPPPDLASSGGALAPGVNVFKLSLRERDFRNLYFRGWGSFSTDNGDGWSLFVAEPPSHYVDDQKAYDWGPPWISLADLPSSHHLNGDLFIVNGMDDQAGTSHPWVVGTWEATTVPEPSTLLLLAAGLAGVVACRKVRERA